MSGLAQVVKGLCFAKNTSYWPNLEGFNSLNSDLLSDEIRDIDFFDHKRNLAI